MSADSPRCGSTASLANNSSLRFATSIDSPDSTKDKSNSLYREAFADADVYIMEGFLDIHPNLHPTLKKLLLPRPCIPSGIKAQVLHSSEDIQTNFSSPMPLFLMTYTTNRDQQISIIAKKKQSGIS
jgi:hypothetical protein